MECATWPDAKADLSSTRRDATAFLDNLEELSEAAVRRSWIARWTNIGDAHVLLADQNVKTGAFDAATEACLCALTAFELARRLGDEEDPQDRGISAKVEAVVERFESFLDKIERVLIPCSDQAELAAYYLPDDNSDLRSPAVICISSEQEPAAILLGRLLPVVTGRKMSVLVVSRADLESDSSGQSEILLSYCLEFLSVRPGVDVNRIGVYGDGLSAALASRFAAFDDRVAAAVCDGGLWNWTWSLASVSWMTRAVDELDVLSAGRSRLITQLRCPVLVVAGGRGVVSVSEALKLQADCMAMQIDLELAIPRLMRIAEEQIEDFVNSDDCIFRWLERKLALVRLRNPL